MLIFNEKILDISAWNSQPKIGCTSSRVRITTLSLQHKSQAVLAFFPPLHLVFHSKVHFLPFIKMHLLLCLQVLLLISSTTASLLPPSSSTNYSVPPPPTLSAPAQGHGLNPRLSWDDIVNGAKSLYSQAMATPTTIEPPSSPSATAAVHGDLQEGDGYNNNTQFKGGRGGWGRTTSGCLACSSKKNGSNILERPGLLAGAGLGLVVLGLFG